MSEEKMTLAGALGLEKPRYTFVNEAGETLEIKLSPPSLIEYVEKWEVFKPLINGNHSPENIAKFLEAFFDLVLHAVVGDKSRADLREFFRYEDAGLMSSYFHMMLTGQAYDPKQQRPSQQNQIGA